MTKAIYVTVMMLFFAGNMFAQTGSVGINNNGSIPDASAMLDVSSTTKGFLPPRMTDLEKTAIANPVAGLMIWCYDCGPSGVMQVYNGTVWTNMGGGSASELAIGQSAMGGIIAYILRPFDPGYDANVQHGLIAATADQSSGIIWAITDYQSTSVPLGTGTAIGTGLANTNNIISQNGSGTSYAAGLARAYNGGGYSDWYLPSRDELAKLYEMKELGFGSFADKVYWSSSEYDASDGWYHGFLYADQDHYNKWQNFLVRAVRAF